MKIKLTILVILLCGLNLTAQVRTDETKVTVNETTGDTVYTQSVTISETEDITTRNHMIVINPLKFLLFYNLSYFNMVSESIAIGGGLQTPTISGVSGIGFNAELRYYPTGKMLRGFYIAPNIAYNNLKFEDESISPFSIGILLGWQWFLGDEFALGLGIGIDYYTGNVKGHNGNIESYDGKVPSLRFDIGYAW